MNLKLYLFTKYFKKYLCISIVFFGPYFLLIKILSLQPQKSCNSFQNETIDCVTKLRGKQFKYMFYKNHINER
jgi:hypothetical protein